MLTEANKFSIRLAISGDEFAIAKVHVQAWQEAYEGLLPQSFLQELPSSLEKRAQNWKGALAHAKRWVYVVEANNQIVGFACFQPGRDTDRTDFGEVSAIYLLKSHKGNGAGFAMLSAGFNRLKDEGFKKAYCWVLENNPTIKFYERAEAKFSGKTKEDNIGGQQVCELEYAWNQLDIGDYDWQPISVEELDHVMKGFQQPWWIAGGWAIDLFLQKQTRNHEDIDILVLREDQIKLQTHLADWDLWAADPPGSLRPWKKGEYLKKGLQDIWGRKTAKDPWQLQIMVFDQENGDWIFKRNETIRRSLNFVTLKTKDGINILAPEVQLLYKSKGLREKDQLDFENASLAMNHQQKQWLKEALHVVYNGQHPWIQGL